MLLILLWRCLDYLVNSWRWRERNDTAAIVNASSRPTTHRTFANIVAQRLKTNASNTTTIDGTCPASIAANANVPLPPISMTPSSTMHLSRSSACHVPIFTPTTMIPNTFSTSADYRNIHIYYGWLLVDCVVSSKLQVSLLFLFYFIFMVSRMKNSSIFYLFYLQINNYH